MANVRARVVAFMDGVSKGVGSIVVLMGAAIDQKPVDPTALIGDGPRATCEVLINLAGTDFMAAPDDISTVSGAESVPTGAVVPTWGGTLLELDLIPSWSVPLLAKTGDSDAI